MFIVESPQKKYEIIEQIGKGSSGNIYKACSSADNKEEENFIKYYTIKICLIADNEDSIWLKNEAQIHEQLSHPNIIKCYESWSDDDFFYFVLEYFDAIDLLDYVNIREIDNDVNELEARVIMIQLTSALEYLSSKHILHRDIKLENILYNRNTQMAKLFDFGFAMQSENDEFDGLCGTPTYIAPEIIRYEKYTYTADVFSLGVCLYALLHNNIPGSTEVFARIPMSDFVINKELSDPLKNLFARIFVEDSDIRINIHELIYHPFLTGKRMEKQCSTGSVLQSKSDYKFIPYEGELFKSVGSLFKINRSQSINALHNEVEHNKNKMNRLSSMKSETKSDMIDEYFDFNLNINLHIGLDF